MKRPIGVAILRTMTAAATLFVLTSCTTPLEKETSEEVVQDAAATESAQLSESAVDLAETKKAEDPKEAVLYKGSDRHVKMPKKQQPVRFVGDDVSLNFEQAPLD